MTETTFTLRTETIELQQLLKATGMVMSGGEARTLITDGQAQVNGEVEIRRSKKLRPGDVVLVGDCRIVIVEVQT